MNLWYVIQTKPIKEKEATTYLSTKGVEVFSPLIETFSSRKGRINKELKPLFPGYIFGKFEISRDYRLVRWARGVKAVLAFGGYPVPISDEVVDLIKERVDESGVVRRTWRFQSDAVVRIKSGPLKDLLGIFERYVSDGERVRVLLNLIGHGLAVELHYSMIEKVA